MASRVSANSAATVLAEKRKPENLPLQPVQYFALSLLAEWQDSQNFVMVQVSAGAPHEQAGGRKRRGEGHQAVKSKKSHYV